MSDNNGLPTGKHTLVEEGTEFKGTLSSKCPIVVMGKVEGDVTGPVIHVTGTGVVAGHVKVKELRSDGEVAGEVEADVVRISGRVRDKTVIRARSLEVSLNVTKGGMEVVFGECELAVGDEPNKDAAVAAALASPAAPGAAPVDAKKPGAAKATPGKPEAAATPAAAASPDDEAGTRRRGTQPPPVS